MKKKNTFPNSITSIGDNAFKGCKNLTELSIPNTVTSIGILAFAGCENLTSITIPKHVKSIGNYAFQNYSGLKQIIIQNSDCEIHEDAEISGEIHEYIFYRMGLCKSKSAEVHRTQSEKIKFPAS